MAELIETDFIELSLAWNGAAGSLALEVTDSGKGFMPAEPQADAIGLPHGRGLTLIKHLSDKFEITPPGNRFKVELSVGRCSGSLQHK